jgi:hypothetical protein
LENAIDDRRNAVRKKYHYEADCGIKYGIPAGFKFFGITLGSHYLKPAPKDHDRANRRRKHKNEIDYFRGDTACVIAIA